MTAPAVPALLRFLPADAPAARQALAESGWECTDAIGRPGAGITGVWEQPGLAAVVSWVRAPEAEIDYFLIGGPERERAQQALAARIRPLEPIAVLNAIGAAKHEGEIAALTVHLGLLACGPFDLPVFRVLTGLLNSRNRVFQNAALVAVGYAAWPEFSTALDRLIADEGSDQEIRAEARRGKTALESSNWNASFRPPETTERAGA